MATSEVRHANRADGYRPRAAGVANVVRVAAGRATTSIMEPCEPVPAASVRCGRAAQDDVEGRIQPGIALRGGDVVALGDGACDLAIVGALGEDEEALAGEGFPQDDAGRVDVGRAADDAVELLGRHVRELALELSFARRLKA